MDCAKTVSGINNYFLLELKVHPNHLQSFDVFFFGEEQLQTSAIDI